jgi:hypothetical protein
MDFWSELSGAAEAVRTGGPSDIESPELSHLPQHVRDHLMTGTAGPTNEGISTGGHHANDMDPTRPELPEHLKNSPYANLSHQELLDLYEKMK